MATGRRSRDGCGGGTLAMVNLASKYLGSGPLGRPPLYPLCLQLIYKPVGVPLDSAVAPQVPAASASTSSVLSLLTGYQMPGVAITGPPSFGASSPRRALDGGMRRSDVPPLVLPSARREVVVSCDVLVRLLLPTLSPHSIGKPSQFVGGWSQDGVAATGVVVALWLW